MCPLTLARRAVAAALMLAQATGHAAPYVLSQVPRQTAFEEPAPNLILSVDNSGSMAYSSRASDSDGAPPDGIQSRLQALQSAVRKNFSADRIPDGRIRLAWQAMNDNAANACVGFFGDTTPGDYGAGNCTLNGRANANLMRPLDAAHRTNLLTWVDALVADGGTPLHAMMTRAGEYMKTTGTHNPYSDRLGDTASGQTGCRRSFHIFMTDGEYNYFGFNADPARLNLAPIGNKDGSDMVLPDGMAYAPRGPFQDGAGVLHDPAKWKKDTDGKGDIRWTPPAKDYRHTLADLAFHYWATDLQPGVNDRVRKIITEAGAVQVGKASVPEYWNPKNDPAIWQHLTTYTIGFGAASGWSGQPNIEPDAAQPSYSGDYAQLVDGSVAWPDPLKDTLKSTGLWNSASGSYGYLHESGESASKVRMELWHAALNGRGQFVPAANTAALDSAFKTILDVILKESQPTSTSITTSASRAADSAMAFQTRYDAKDWSGDVIARKFSAGGDALAADPQWSARQMLGKQSYAERRILSFSRSAAAPGGTGIPFRWDHLSSAQQAALRGSTGTNDASTDPGQAVLNFLRGDRSNEGNAGLKLRERAHVLGDIAGSAVWYAGKPRSGFSQDGYAAFAATARASMVYVGGNDGMLHAFNANNGREAFAYVPEGLYGTAAAPGLKRLSEASYAHRYYVDGSPFVADVYLGTELGAKASDAQKAAHWRSLLVGTLGAGGKGYFVLDVTKPEDVTEQSAASTVWIDTTATTDADIGHQFQQPALDPLTRRALQVVTLNNGRRALILGNGYNSADEKAVLLIQYLDDDRSLFKIPVSAKESSGGGNGLSAPLPVDRNGDDKIDLVYAGDLHGNLWKFDLGDADPKRWGATPSTGAAGADSHGKPLFAAGSGQPITAAPTVVGHPRGGYLVAFGTGRLFAAEDDAHRGDQYLYGVWDRDGANTVPLSGLVEQTIDAEVAKDGATRYRKMSGKRVDYASKLGWFLKLPVAKERVIYQGDRLSNSIALFSTTIPGTSSDQSDCVVGEPDNGWSMVIDLFGGTVPEGVGYVGADSGMLGKYLGFENRSGKDDIALVPRDGSKGNLACNATGDCKSVIRPDVVRRFGWRNLILSQ